MLPGIRSLLAVAVTLIVFVGAFAWQDGKTEKPTVPPLVSHGGPRWYKGNLHTHSLWSDGDDFPEMIADWYKRQGYHFLALSDHNVLSEGERWLDVPAKGVRPLALARYRARFG